jgi:hypothetical protein
MKEALEENVPPTENKLARQKNILPTVYGYV